MGRKEGYYWIRLKAYSFYGINEDWQLARWNGDDWYITGLDVPFKDKDVLEIGELIAKHK